MLCYFSEQARLLHTILAEQVCQRRICLRHDSATTGGLKIYIALAVWLIAIIFLSFGIKSIWSRYFKWLNLFLYPGTVIHELSHAALCLITGATITEFNLLRLKDVEIKYDTPKVPVFGDFLIVFAPIVACTAVWMSISVALGSPVTINASLPKDIVFTGPGFFEFAKDLIDTVKFTTLGLWQTADIKNPRWIGFVVATIVFTVSMAPQAKDLKYLIPGIIILAFIFFFLAKFNMGMGPWITRKVSYFWVAVNLAGCMLLSILALTAIALGIYSAVRLIASRKKSE